MTNEELWQAVLAQIQLNISPANFATWFKNTAITDQKDNEVIVSVPNSFVKEWLEQKYQKSILKILHSLDEKIKGIKFTTAKTESKPFKKISLPLEISPQLTFPELKTNQETNLNPRYTFENFIIGSFNELAQAAAWAVGKNPGSVYNPLFIYGGVGLGKTHLLQAIGNEISKTFSEKKVKYLSAEKFTFEIISAIKNQKINEINSKYRSIDVLIIDDVQFLAGKEKTQDEFFHTFNTLYEKGKQIVISSDRPPKAIPALTERLRSRFEGGMMADITFPDFESRVAILKVKARERNLNLSEEIYEYIASNIQKSIRELEGALNRLMIDQKINNRTPSLEIVKNLLKGFLLSPSRVITPKKIIQSVADFFDLKEKDLLKNTRKIEIVRPRQIAMYLLRDILNSSYPFIGRKFGGKDHTTAIHSFEKINQELKNNDNLKGEIELIKQRIFSG